MSAMQPPARSMQRKEYRTEGMLTPPAAVFWLSRTKRPSPGQILRTFFLCYKSTSRMRYSASFTTTASMPTMYQMKICYSTSRLPYDSSSLAWTLVGES